jgi:hypothetical protein
VPACVFIEQVAVECVKTCLPTLALKRLQEWVKSYSVLDRGKPYLMKMWQLHYENSKALLGEKVFNRAYKKPIEPRSLATTCHACVSSRFRGY